MFERISGPTSRSVMDLFSHIYTFRRVTGRSPSSQHDIASPFTLAFLSCSEGRAHLTCLRNRGTRSCAGHKSHETASTCRERRAWSGRAVALHARELHLHLLVLLSYCCLQPSFSADTDRSSARSITHHPARSTAYRRRHHIPLRYTYETVVTTNIITCHPQSFVSPPLPLAGPS